MKGLERSSEQYTYDLQPQPESVDRFIDQPHHFYASSFCTWKTGKDLRTVTKFMDKEGYPYTLWYVPVSNEENYEIRRYAPQVEGAFVIAFFGGKKEGMERPKR